MERIEKFEAILDLEAEVRGEQAGVAFAPIGLPQRVVAARRRNLAQARQSLASAIDSLSPAEMQAFGEYRCAAMKGA